MVSEADLSSHLPYRSLPCQGSGHLQQLGGDHEGAVPNEMNMGEDVIFSAFIIETAIVKSVLIASLCLLRYRIYM